MKFRQFLGLASVFASTTTPGLAGAASVIDIDGITFQPGALIETIDLFEGERNGGPLTAPGQELIGIGIVNRILDSENKVLWQHGDNGRELTLHFHSYFAESFSTTALGGLGLDTISFSGGVVELYVDSTPDFSAAGSIADGIASATDGKLFLRLAGSPTGGAGATSGNAITLNSLGLRFGNAGTPFAQANSLAGNGLLDVTGGIAAAWFDTNAFGCDGSSAQPCANGADKPFSSSGQLPSSLGSAWAFRGTGEVQSSVVPLPGSLALLGSGLFGLAARFRRKAV